MTKFSARNDTGYDRVSNQLFLWIRELASQTSVDDMRNRRIERFEQSSPRYPEIVNSGTGTVVLGNISGGSVRFGA